MGKCDYRWKETERNRQITLRVVSGEKLTDIARDCDGQGKQLSIPRIEQIVCATAREIINEDRARYLAAKALTTEYRERLKQLLKS